MATSTKEKKKETEAQKAVGTTVSEAREEARIMGTKKQTPLEDDDLLISHQIAFEEAGLAFDWLESIADLMSVAVTSVNELGDETIYNAAWIMEEIAKAGHACWRREQETQREKLVAAGAVPALKNVKTREEKGA